MKTKHHTIGTVLKSIPLTDIGDLSLFWRSWLGSLVYLLPKLKIFLFGFPIFRLGAYLVKVIPETRRTNRHLFHIYLFTIHVHPKEVDVDSKQIYIWHKTIMTVTSDALIWLNLISTFSLRIYTVSLCYWFWIKYQTCLSTFLYAQ